jgi:hypothetical protein
MLCHVNTYQYFSVTERLHLQSQAVKEWTIPGLLVHIDEGATVIQNFGKHLQTNSFGMLNSKRVKNFTLLHAFMTNMLYAH